MNDDVFTRKCQECGHRQIAKHPQEYRDESWRDVKCRSCRSNALDYGKHVPRDRIK